MNRRMVFYTLGQLTVLEGALMLLPLGTALLYRERTVSSFLCAIGIAFLAGSLLMALFRPKNRIIYAKEGFIITALSWIVLSAVGALPFFISGEIPSYIDAFFETVSGFTTTGASILTNVESLSHGILFWRSFTHWIGGMGILVLMMAILPASGANSGRSIHIMRAEMPGPVVGKLVPRLRDTAKILYLIYIVLTALLILVLFVAGMPLFDSVVNAFATAGTGGFCVRADSIAGYAPHLQWILTVGMLMFGVNFNLYYLILIRNLRGALRSAELWCYLAICAVSAGIITLNLMPSYGSISHAFRDASVQVASIMTTTGYASVDFDLWPQLSKAVLFLLMFVGGCAGSTAGGLKVSRVMLLLRYAKQSLMRMLHPRSVRAVHMDGKKVDEATVESISPYLILYFCVLICTYFLLCFDAFDFETNITAAVTCFNNVGPGFAAVGPTQSFAAYSAFSKLVLSAAMLLGRLEIIPLLITFSPSTWTKK